MDMRTITYYTHPYETSNSMSALVIHAMAGLLLAAVVPEAEARYGTVGYWTILTMVGSLGASMMAFTLNRVTEDPKAVFGRVIGAIFTGVALPRVAMFAYPPAAEKIHDPIILAAFGFICALIGYAGAAYLVEKAFKVAPSLVDQQIDKLADVVSDKVVAKSTVDKSAPASQDTIV